VGCGDVRLYWAQEVLRWWYEDLAKGVAMVSEGVQIGVVKAWREVSAMVSDGVQLSGKSDPDLKREGEPRPSYCRSAAIVWAIS
jgi:hypothetical protein